MRGLFNNFFAYPSNKEVIINITKELKLNESHILQCYTKEGVPSLLKTNEVPSSTKLISIDYFDAFYCIYKGVDWNELTPLDSDIIHEYNRCELESMEILERIIPMTNEFIPLKLEKEVPFDKILLKFEINKFYKETTSYQERKRNYHRHLRFWNNYFDKNKIDFFFCAAIPHLTFDFIIYWICKNRNIPVFFASHVPVVGRMLILSDLKNYGDEIVKVIDGLKVRIKNFDDIKFEDSTLIEWNRLCTPTSKQIPPFYVNHFINFDNNRAKERKKYYFFRIKKYFTSPLSSFYNFYKRIIDIDYWHYRIKGLNDVTIQEGKLFSFYESKCSIPDFSKKYIYLPLHFQPESSSAPIGGIFANQLLMVQLLSSTLPNDVLIYLKENPFQKFANRTIQFYLDLLDINNVRFISRKINSFDLIENCVAVATISGTAGWEGLFKGKPCILFGDYITQYAPCVFRVSSHDDCKNAIQKIFEENVKFSLNDLKIFFKALELVTVHAWVNPTEQEVVKISFEQCVKNLTDAYLIKMKEKLNITNSITNKSM